MSQNHFPAFPRTGNIVSSHAFTLSSAEEIVIDYLQEVPWEVGTPLNPENPENPVLGALVELLRESAEFIQSGVYPEQYGKLSKGNRPLWLWGVPEYEVVPPGGTTGSGTTADSCYSDFLSVDSCRGIAGVPLLPKIVQERAEDVESADYVPESGGFTGIPPQNPGKRIPPGSVIRDFVDLELNGMAAETKNSRPLLVKEHSFLWTYPATVFPPSKTDEPQRRPSAARMRMEDLCSHRVCKPPTVATRYRREDRVARVRDDGTNSYGTVVASSSAEDSSDEEGTACSVLFDTSLVSRFLDARISQLDHDRRLASARGSRKERRSEDMIPLSVAANTGRAVREFYESSGLREAIDRLAEDPETGLARTFRSSHYYGTKNEARAAFVKEFLVAASDSAIKPFSRAVLARFAELVLQDSRADSGATEVPGAMWLSSTPVSTEKATSDNADRNALSRSVVRQAVSVPQDHRLRNLSKKRQGRLFLRARVRFPFVRVRNPQGSSYKLLHDASLAWREQPDRHRARHRRTGSSRGQDDDNIGNLYEQPGGEFDLAHRFNQRQARYLAEKMMSTRSKRTTSEKTSTPAEDPISGVLSQQWAVPIGAPRFPLVRAMQPFLAPIEHALLRQSGGHGREQTPATVGKRQSGRGCQQSGPPEEAFAREQSRHGRYWLPYEVFLTRFLDVSVVERSMVDLCRESQLSIDPYEVEDTVEFDDEEDCGT